MNRTKLLLFVSAAALALSLAGCGARARQAETIVTPAQTVTVENPAETSPIVIVTPSPTGVPEAAPTTAPFPTQPPAPTPTPAPKATPAPTPAPTRTPASGVPTVTKSPTDETVEAGGSCWFVAKYENAIWAEWHFVSPDGKTDLDYSKITDQFPKLEVSKGFASTTHLNNIPREMDGWKVYCRFSNNAGSVKTGTAKLTVTAASGGSSGGGAPAPAPAAGAPRVTKSPTDETVEPGGSCRFVAKYENAIYAEWHFVSPDGKTDLDYSKINTQFSKLEVVKGFASTTQLNNIPAEMDGWKVYCRFSNDAGSVNTGTASITVTSGSGTQAAQVIAEDPPAPAAEQQTAEPSYAGTYQETVRGASIHVSGPANNAQVTITWASSATESSTWTFSGAFDANGVLQYSSAVKTDSTYDETGAATTVTSHTSGQLRYSSDPKGLYWSDSSDAENGRTGSTFFARQ